ncbi:MAG: alcohol dehydrogenase catalytic domain-containing protein [Chloroflexi bacterium]|nr:alcohol dehydrogenase catalytic domain-containing protein [Chloroflexota bacterium]
MRVGMLQETGRVVVQEAPRPRPAPDEVLIRVAYAGVCGSDLHAFTGTHPFRKPPVVLGHEVSGTIAEAGAEVTGLQVGDRVTVMPYVSCGRCHYCAQGRTNICENKIVPGIGGWQGTFADLFIARADITYPLGPDTSLVQGALAEPLAVGAHAVARGGVAPGNDVLVLGGGTIGLLTGYAALRAGARSVALTDLYDYNLRVAREIGIPHAYNARSEGLEDAIRRDYPEGLDVIFLAGAAPVLVGQATRLARRGGRIVSTALFDGPVPVDVVAMTLYELELVGTQIYQATDFFRALAWLNEDGPRLERLVDHVMPLEQAHEAMTLLAERREDVVKILLQPENER